MRNRSSKLRTIPSARTNIRRQNHSLSPRKRKAVNSYGLRSTSSLNSLNIEFDSRESSDHAVLAAKTKLSRRMPYTDSDDYAILDYVITHDLLGKVRCFGTWVALETAGITRHPASSMRCRFLRNIIYHFSEVLRCTAEGRRKYSDPTVIKEFHLRCLATSHSPEKNPSSGSPLALSDLSYFTNDNSPHDSDRQNTGPLIAVSGLQESTPQLPIRLVDYNDSQSSTSPLKRSDLSTTSTDVFTAVRKGGRIFTHRRTCLSSPSDRRKRVRFRCLDLRPQEAPDNSVNVEVEEITIDDTSSNTPQNDETLCQASSSKRTSQVTRKTSSRAGSLHKESVSSDLDSSPSAKRCRKTRHIHRRKSQIDLEASKDSEAQGDLVNVELVQDTLPEASTSSSAFIAGTQEQSLPSDGVPSDVPGGIPLKFPLMEAWPTVSNEVVLSRTVDYTRQLDSFSHHHHLSTTDASLLLHVTSGDFEAAHSYLEARKQHLWFPSDDARLLSTSVTDINTVITKFGLAEVSRRLIYLTGRTLFS
ncbi:hypothetical protein Aperf_G00000101733 [Anoplocephala perfoliata]